MNRNEAWRLVDNRAHILYSVSALTLLRLILKRATVRVGKMVDQDANVERTLTLPLDYLKKPFKDSTYYLAFNKLEADGIIKECETVKRSNRKRPEIRFTFSLDKLKELPEPPTVKEQRQDRALKARTIRAEQRQDEQKVQDARDGLLNCILGNCPRYQQAAVAA